jgi:hypothetical protein
MYTETQIRTMILTNDVAAMRAVCALYRRQTSDEKMSEDARHDNRRGFSKAHARLGSKLARYMTAGVPGGKMRRPVSGTVSPWYRDSRNRWKKSKSELVGETRVEACRAIALHYVAQLTRIANGE